MKKKGYRGTRCEKRHLSKCADGVVRTFTPLESNLADLLQADEDVKEFSCNVLLENLDIGEFTTDFVVRLMNGDLRIYECAYRKQLLKPRTAKLLDASRDYWHRREVDDWVLVVEKKEDGDGEEPTD